MEYRRRLTIPGWIGTRQDLVILADSMTESIAPFRVAYRQKDQAVEAAVSSSPPAVRALMLLLGREHQEKTEKSWATTVELTESSTGLVRTGSAETVLPRVAERYITELNIIAPYEASGPKAIVRFRPTEVEVEVSGEDETWVTGEAARLKEALSLKLPKAFVLHDPTILGILSTLIILPLIWLGLTVVNSVAEALRKATAPVVGPFGNVTQSGLPQGMTDFLVRMEHYVGWFYLLILTVMIFVGLTNGLSLLASTVMPKFQVLEEGAAWRGKGALALVGTVSIAIVTGVVGNMVYSAYFS